MKFEMITYKLLLCWLVFQRHDLGPYAVLCYWGLLLHFADPLPLPLACGVHASFHLSPQDFPLFRIPWDCLVFSSHKFAQKFGVDSQVYISGSDQSLEFQTRISKCLQWEPTVGSRRSMCVFQRLGEHTDLITFSKWSLVPLPSPEPMCCEWFPCARHCSQSST